MAIKRIMSARVIVAAGLAAILATAGGVAVARNRAASAMANAATAFLESLTPEQREKAVFRLDNNEERLRWHFIPTAADFPRNGLPLKDMDQTQRRAAHDLLRAGLSQAGYLTATTIMDLERVLHEMTGQSIRDPELYFFSIFGTPSPTGTWGLRVEGHHLSLHFTIDGAKMAIASSPAFLGSNPAEIRQGPRAGFRVLGAQEDAARALLGSLTDQQRPRAIIAEAAPTDIATMNAVKVDPLAPAGLMASDMTADQRDLLVGVLEIYASVMADDVAADRMAKIREAGLDKVGFAWAGPTERGQRYHYRIQGPTFLIEHNNTQGRGNHVHSVWRDFNGDFGRDLIGEHLAAMPH